MSIAKIIGSVIRYDYITNRIDRLKEQFEQIYSHKAEVIVNSPGRVEIIGNHTDYNLGYALSAAISKSTLCLLAKRQDRKVVALSTMPESSQQKLEFSLDQISRSEQLKWGNYLQAVALELVKAGKRVTGAEILVDTNFPASGGLSSSAALELAVAFGLLSLSGEKLDRQELAWLCKTAENSGIVKSPCGFLDQGTIAFAERGKMVFLDFQPPVTVKLIPAELGQARFVVVVDRQVKRILGESGYPARRKMCEVACKRLKLKSLRELSVSQFKLRKNQLPRLMQQRVKHVVYENQRVLEAVQALKQNDLPKFGQLLTQSGKSALDLYGLDENTPELRWLMEKSQQLSGVLGARNMGGGFSAIVLALVKANKLKQFKEKLSQLYLKKYQNQLEFIEFNLSQGVTIL